MTSAVAEPARVLRGIPGRVRVHLPGWAGGHATGLERRLEALPGVTGAVANPRTANVLVRYDPAATDASALVAALTSLDLDDSETQAEERSGRSRSHRPAALREGRRGRRLRIAVRGLERDTDLARQVVERLQHRPEVVRAVANQLTGRVLVELGDEGADLAELLEDISELEADETPHDEVPGHPLDPAPLIQSTARLIGSALGLGVLALRRGVGATGAPVSAGAPAAVAATVGIVEGLPQLGRSIEGRLGRDRTQLLFGALTILSLTSSGGALGLAVSGATALGAVTELRARRAAWRDYEERTGAETSAHPGAVLRLEPGGRAPLAAEVLEGFGRAVGPDGATVRVAPGARLPTGARVYGAGVTVRLAREPPFAAGGRRAPPPRSPLDRYLDAIVPASLGFGALLGVLRRSPLALFTGLLLVNPRAALTGVEQADSRASARALRCGATVVSTRRRALRKPDLLLIAEPRALTDGLEVGEVTALGPEEDSAGLLAIAAAVAAAAGSPWGPAFRASGRLEAVDGTFDGSAASAEIDGERWTLGPPAGDDHAAATRARSDGEEPLLLARLGDGEPRAVLSVRPRLAAGIRPLLLACARRDVRLAVVSEAPPSAATAVARRAGVRLLAGAPLHECVDEAQRHRAVVAVLADATDGGRAFQTADLAIGLTSGRSGPLPARADLLAPNLATVADILDTGARRDAAVRDSVRASIAANAAGVVWGLGAAPQVRRGSTATYLGTLAAIAAGWRRLRGGRRPRSVAERLLDPAPERWGRLGREQALAAVASRPTGLTDAEAAERWRPRPRLAEDGGFMAALVEQTRSPLVGALAAGAGLSLAIGAIADAALIGAVIVANAAIGAWQQGKAGRAAAALERMTVHTATVLRDGEERTVVATDVVRGDIVIVGPGARVPADARLLDADGLEVDEAALSGESLPVPKRADGGGDAARVLLDGSDVVAGRGRAVVVAAGPDTRLGTLAAALGLGELRESPLDLRLQAILRAATPLIAVASGLVLTGGLAWGAPLVPQLALAAGVAIAAVPEGLPLLAGLASAAVARRLAGRNALVRRLAGVESFGRVDVACADKTGTITEGRLAVRLVAGPDGPGAPPEGLDRALAEILLAAALASPHPRSAHAGSHPTDLAVQEAARRAGLDGRLDAARTAELPFEASRGFHAAVVERRLVVKGAAEQLVARCATLRRASGDVPLQGGDREALLARAEQLATDGLRVLMVAEGARASLADPADLVALGFVGIADPLRATVPAAVRRCREAGVRVVMLTGDHPATARAIGRSARLPVDGDSVLTGADIAALRDGELSARLDRASVVARITPLDKVRIVEALQRAGHVVAMTGDGVNDAPALRLADVGVAMGRAGTQVARESADVVLADDDFSTLVEVLVEGRGFWANMRRSLAVLLGGNLGELGLMVGATVAGLPSPLTTRQVLTVNLVTDVLPAVAVAVQEPEHRDLDRLAREGATGLDAPLRHDILRRGIATAAPSLAAYVAAHRMTTPQAARSVAFASVVATQLGHTADLGRNEGRLSGQLLGAIAASAAVTAAALTAPGVQGFLGLATLSPLGAGLVVAATAAAVSLARLLSVAGADGRPPGTTAPPPNRLLSLASP